MTDRLGLFGDPARRVVSAFPATGKSHFAANRDDVIDSDSGRFSWAQFGPEIQRSPYWPSNYIAHIREGVDAGNLVLVSTHQEVRDALVKAEIPFVLVYPGEDQKEDYRRRMQRRGSPQPLVDKIVGEWLSLIASCRMQKGCMHVVLDRGEYLGDLLREAIHA